MDMEWLTALGTAFVLPAVVTAVIAYFCGCFNGAVIVSKYILHDDVRTHGSGNAGLTNFLRTFGGPWTFVVILCDVLKAVIAILAGAAIARHLVVDDGAILVLAKYWAACFCLLGHMFPCMFGFKGGKGILSGGTIAIMLSPKLALLVWGGFLILTALTRYVSLGSVFAAAAFPVGTWLFVSHDPVIMALAIFLGGLVLWMHRANIKRLLTRTENKLSFHKKE
ncbi:MAG: glycerol-3-phosphate acyltransferase [Oscillospiraceae bacterium]|nr:glycerol-3-phosphate acyltransferase [Oscillospiraceae bacterium]